MIEDLAIKVAKLNQLSEVELNQLLVLEEADKNSLIYYLIKNHYPNIALGEEEYYKLALSYRASWVLEKIYRNNVILRESYSTIYTKSGLMKEIALNQYMLVDLVNRVTLN